MFSYVSLEDRIPKNHPLRFLGDTVLATMDREFAAVYAKTGRPSVPPERLLKAMRLPILFTIRSERLWVESIDYRLLYRWFVGLAIDDAVGDHSPFSQNRDRLFNEGLARVFFERVKALADWRRLTSREHFSIDGTLDRRLGLAPMAQRRTLATAPQGRTTPRVSGSALCRIAGTRLTRAR